MDYLSLIKLPIEAELADFIDLFNKSLMHSDGLLSQVLDPSVSALETYAPYTHLVDGT